MPMGSQRAQSQKRDQYVNTLKRALHGLSQKEPSTASEWAELFVSVEARRKIACDASDAIGARGIQSGYGFYTHEVRNGALEKRQHATISDRDAEQRCWKAFCERTGRDALREREAAKAGRRGTRSGPTPTPKKRSVNNTSPRSVSLRVPNEGLKGPRAATTEACLRTRTRSPSATAAGLSTRGRSFECRSRESADRTSLRDAQSVRMRGCGHAFEVSESSGIPRVGPSPRVLNSATPTCASW